MCGIVSIFAYNPTAPPVDRAELLRIRDRMTARGPDGCGAWYSSDSRVGLGHRRLAIIDLSETGAQPMTSGDGSLVITFNGEIYNYRELRAVLETKGCRFRSASDTEVLLHLYAEKGPEMVHDLRGMYAFAIWDERKKGLFLARDPFGIKPLYYADDGKTFRAASQVKALLAGGKIDTTPDPAGHVGFFLWGHVPGPYTLYRGIRSLPAGSYLWLSPSSPLPAPRSPLPAHSFCSIPDELRKAEQQALSLSGPAKSERLREALLDSVSHHLIADVPVGVFLSSGLDSTTLTAFAAETGAKGLHSITLGFNEYRGTENDEVTLAEEVARRCGTVHRTIWVEKVDFQAQLQDLLEAMDQPTTDGVNSYFISLAAVRAGLKVAISGLGGDELFGSYPSFSQVPRMARLLGPLSVFPGLGRAFHAVSVPLLKHFTSPKYAGLLEYGGSYGGAYLLRRGMFMPWELPTLLDGEMVREGWDELQTLARLNETTEKIGNDYLKVSALEMTWYMRNQLLRDTDWASMAHSLEVRLPLVDLPFLREAAPLLGAAGSPGKRDLAASAGIPLPAAVLNRRKTGFVVPVREWLQDVKGDAGERGLRGWAKGVYKENLIGSASGLDDGRRRPAVHHRSGPARTLVLLTDAYGGIGGIALYNRDLLTALCSQPDCTEVVVLPRIMPRDPEPMPEKLTYVKKALAGKGKYIAALLNTLAGDRRFDLVVCGHINLLSLALLAKKMVKAPLVLEIYGIDAWHPTKSFLINRLVGKIDAFISISEITRRRFLAWTKLDPGKGRLLPNAIHSEEYGPRPKNTALLNRYGLAGKKVLMTLGRMVSYERYKGFDEVLDVLPDLARAVPDIAYLIVGDGNDRERLVEKTKRLGLKDRVVFAGYIPEEEKADHYRLADVYVMPSRGEGFGFVFLEALACGIPAIGSTVDGSQEALRDGQLGMLVDPARPEELKTAILQALQNHHKEIPAGLDYFSFKNFSTRLSTITTALLTQN